VAIQIPLGAGPAHQKDAFRGIIDLVRGKLLTFSSATQGVDITESSIPDEYATQAESWRNRMLEQLYDYSDELMELALADHRVPEATLHAVLRKATCHGYVQPVLCGSALNYIGIQPLLDAVAAYLPSPADMPPVQGIHPSKGGTLESRPPRPDAPFCGLVFKIVADRHGDLHYVRVYSGEMTAGMRVLNPAKEKRENVPRLWHIQADQRQQVRQVSTGDIVGVIGLRHSITGDTLCHPQHPILLETIAFPESVLSMAIEPESSAERDKLAQTLATMRRQDPTFTARENAETGQTLIGGMGELHLEVIKHRLQRDFNLNVRVHQPRVSYRETVEKAVEVDGLCQRQVAGQPLVASVRLRMEPVAGATTQVTVTSQPGLDLPATWVDAVRQVLTELGSGSGALGFPLMKVKMTILGGTAEESESSVVALQIAAADAFRKALDQAGIVLLEPIMRVEINTPEEHLGDFMADLQQRRATIHRTQTRGRNTLIEAEAPLASLFGYSSVMRNLSQGRATSTMEPACYGPAPAEVLRGFL
jgi:elongation factor G